MKSHRTIFVVEEEVCDVDISLKEFFKKKRENINASFPSINESNLKPFRSLKSILESIQSILDNIHLENISKDQENEASQTENGLLQNGKTSLLLEDQKVIQEDQEGMSPLSEEVIEENETPLSEEVIEENETPLSDKYSDYFIEELTREYEAYITLEEFINDLSEESFNYFCDTVIYGLFDNLDPKLLQDLEGRIGEDTSIGSQILDLGEDLFDNLVEELSPQEPLECINPFQEDSKNDYISESGVESSLPLISDEIINKEEELLEEGSTEENILDLSSVYLKDYPEPLKHDLSSILREAISYFPNTEEDKDSLFAKELAEAMIQQLEKEEEKDL